MIIVYFFGLHSDNIEFTTNDITIIMALTVVRNGLPKMIDEFLAILGDIVSIIRKLGGKDCASMLMSKSQEYLVHLSI